MARESLDLKFRHLYDGIMVMDSMVEMAITGAVESLRKHDLAAAKRIYESDRILNNKRFELENDLVVTIATAQPIMASDLRKVASIYEIISELERMGDYAKGIAKITLLIGEYSNDKTMIDITKMVDIGVNMLHQAVGAFLSGDIETAQRIPQDDDKVDFLYNQISRDLIKTILANPDLIENINHLLWAAHNLERFADRVMNICERTIYNVTGNLIELDKSDDETAFSVSMDKSKGIKRVLFLCTGNSCRSQIAEAIVNDRLADTWHAYSAGTAPAGFIHPMALQVLGEIGINHQGESKHVKQYQDVPFDLVITVCDSAAEECPIWIGSGTRVHRGFTDPAKTSGTDEEVLAVFRLVRDEIGQAITELLQNS